MRTLVLTSILALAACNTYRDELARGQQAFEQNDHDRALALLRDLEPDVKRLAPAEQAQYAYLRGVTDYRIGYRSDARHWLLVAKAYEDHSPGLLAADSKARLSEALDELDGVVFTQGTGALTTARKAPDERRPQEKRPEPTKDSSPKVETPKEPAVDGGVP